MTTFWVLIGLTLVVAAADWWAVSTDRRQVEYVLKPLTMVVLIAAALALPDPVTDGARLFMVVGLVCSLAGDVFLMLDERLFLGGLVVVPGRPRHVHHRPAALRRDHPAAAVRRASWWSWSPRR